MAGRKPTPTHLKVLRGNPGKRGINKKEPKPKAGIPPKPASLGGDAGQMWDRLAPELEAMGVLTTADAAALELACLAWEEYLDAKAAIAEHGSTYETVNQQGGQMFRARPEVAMASDAYRRFTRLLTEFGLTPSSRSRVSAAEREADDPMARLLGG